MVLKKYDIIYMILIISHTKIKYYYSLCHIKRKCVYCSKFREY